MFYMVQPQKIKFGDMVVIESVIDLTSIFAAADKLHVTQPTQLVRYRRFGHFELISEVTNVHLTIKQYGDDPQASRVTEGAEQVSQVSGSLVF